MIFVILTGAVLFMMFVIFWSYLILNTKGSNNDILKDNVSILADKFKENDINPDMALANDYIKFIKTNELMGISHKKAMGDAAKEIIEREALYSAAVQKGLDLSEADVIKEFNKTLKMIRDSENYEDIRQIYSENGMSFDDSYIMDLDYQRKAYAIKALTLQLKRDYIRLKGEIATDLNQYLVSTKNHFVYEYKRTNNFKVLKKSIKEGVKLLDDDSRNSPIIPYLKLIYDLAD